MKSLTALISAQPTMLNLGAPGATPALTVATPVAALAVATPVAALSRRSLRLLQLRSLNPDLDLLPS